MRSLSEKRFETRKIFHNPEVSRSNRLPATKKNRGPMPGGRKTVKSKKSENNVFSRGSGVTSVTPFPLSSAHLGG